ncbi:BREX-5 system adenine-specific DNA-methyltransferase PglX [Halorubrum sp. HHNYT27]|uniref:BREX-5 system adenine-specific DNA-methyltransferase PglX n=1 Tax=Halorubrum sp. HHNYT27 TaxID=3402275 RepID=UPI003EC15129
MSGSDSTQRKAQLDKAEREHLEDVVTDLRELVEREIEYELEHQYELTSREGGEGLSTEEEAIRKKLVEAIEYENPGEKSWQWAYDQYVTGVGYTLVNRLAALRCMEVRGFLDQPVTQIGDSGLTPAAEQVLGERFDVGPDEALIVAFQEACEQLDDEIEILFDTNSPYTVLDIEPDLFEDAVAELDEIPEAVWRADDVLGWVYEYYNRPVVEALDAKNSLEPEDVGPANQFYTPHWVVRMLADNSLGKLYLEATDREDSIPDPEALSPDERKNRLVTPEDSPNIPELCTYLIPDEEPGDAPEFDHPRELRVIDPACGSGHFLLYAFDILERIWWAETELDRAEIPAKVLEHNLYGVDIDLRSCQLSAFNLYLKARTRAEAEDGAFEMPNVGIVCADASIAEVEEATDVLDEITGEGSDLREALDDVIETFQHTEALGSLLDVSGTLEAAFDASKTQTELGDYNGGTHQSLNSFLKALRRAVDDQTGDSFGEQNLRSFLHLLVVLTQEYDTALMNPPYGMRGRMPDAVQEYVSERYDYHQDYYVNFFEVCERLSKRNGRVGMLVPWSFMFRKVFESFRVDFVSQDRAFDFLAEFGYDVLDNAMVGTVGTVVRTAPDEIDDGQFIRLHDVPKADKETTFLSSAFVSEFDDEIKRRYTRSAEDFSIIPGAPISYWVPRELRDLYNAETVLDADNAELPKKESIGSVKVGLQSGDDGRFLPFYWEVLGILDQFPPVSNGGSDTWLLPKNTQTIQWENNGDDVRRYSGSYLRSPHLYFNEGITFNRRKRSGRHFGFMHAESIFTESGTAIFPEEMNTWTIISYLNSRLVTYLKLAQTFERKWETGTVSRLPVSEVVFENSEVLAESAKSQFGKVLGRRSTEFTSPHFSGTLAAQMLGYGNPNPPDHPHRTLLEEIDWETPPKMDRKTSIKELARSGEDYLKRLDRELEQSARKTDQLLFDRLNLSEDLRREILQEVELRTIDDPLTEWDQVDSEREDAPSISLTEFVQNLLLQFTMDVVRESNDGIVPLSSVEGSDGLLNRIEEKFERVWGDHAADRLAEVDDVLGGRSAAEEAYPNLQAWLEDDLFDYHVATFDRTPILWRFTTTRLVSDPEGEGFGCLVDYHQLDEGIFDRLQNRYLDPRKELLRERRNTADRRRSNDSLSTSEQAEAAEEYTRYQSCLEQIAEFEDNMAELAQQSLREWPEDKQDLAAAAADRVSEFRALTEERLDDVDELAAMEDVDLAELFTGNFYEKVENQREEWIDGLEDLETAFDAYAADPDEPVEAHLYDLFEYYTDDLLGSSHFASNGILYMTYYFDKLGQVDQSQLENDEEFQQQRLISQLASDLEEYIELGEAINEDCTEVSSEIPADWADRALSEITTAGYQPNHKHGVAINITPLAEQQIVPKTVDDDVL